MNHDQNFEMMKQMLTCKGLGEEGGEADNPEKIIFERRCIYGSFI